jgi:hypothetical protein
MNLDKLKTQREQMVEQRRQLEGQHAFMTGRIQQIDDIIKEAEGDDTEEAATTAPVNGHADMPDSVTP